MKYQLMIRSRPNVDESIPDKHSGFMAALAKIKDGWGLIGSERPRLKDKKLWSEFGTGVRLKGFLGTGIKGEVRYMRRETIAFYKTDKDHGEKYVDEGKNDDYFTITFDPHKVNYQALVQTAFPQYLAAFAPYTGEIGDAEFGHLDFDEWRKTPGAGERAAVYRIYPVSFWDQELCRRAFRLTPQQIEKRTSGNVEKVARLGDGVLIVASSQILNLEDADDINHRLKPLLTGKPVSLPSKKLRIALDEAKKQAERVKVKPSKKNSVEQKPERSGHMLALARAVINAMMFLELSDGEVVDNRAALKAEELIAANLQKTTEVERAALRIVLEEMTMEERAYKSRPEVLELLSDFMDNLGLPDEEDE